MGFGNSPPHFAGDLETIAEASRRMMRLSERASFLQENTNRLENYISLNSHSSLFHRYLLLSGIAEEISCCGRVPAARLSCMNTNQL